MSEAHHVVLTRRSEGAPVVDDFRTESTQTPAAGDGQLLVRVLFLSLDPYLRGKISGRHMSGAIHPGEVMAGESVGEVAASNHPEFTVGDIVRAETGWRTHAVVNGDQAAKVTLPRAQISLALGALGMPGLTAYAGVTRLAQVKAGDTFVVSAASGPVGSMAGQIARMRGARTVAIAGSDQKCAWCLEAAKFDAAINYKTEAIRDGLSRTCPDGVDVYYDNIGGDMLTAAVERLAIGGRVVLCGLAAQYNSETVLLGPPPGLIIKARATIRGLVVYDHEDLRPEMERVCGAWAASGDVAVNEDITEGLANAPAAFARLTRGENFGKTLVKVA